MSVPARGIVVIMAANNSIVNLETFLTDMITRGLGVVSSAIPMLTGLCED